MDVIKKIMYSLAIIGSLTTLNNLAMSMEWLAAQDVLDKIIFKEKPLNQGDLEYVRVRLANFPGLANTRFYDGLTLLIKAIRLAKDQVVQLFLQDPAIDVTIPDLEGNTPLHYLFSPPIGCWEAHPLPLMHSRKPLIQLMLERGASPFVLNKKGESVLAKVKWEYPEIYNEYLGKYARYAKLLYISAFRGHLSGVHYALEKGNVSVNMKNNDLLDGLSPNEIGNTPFHAAILSGLNKYDQLLPEINRINESRNVGANKLLPASYFNKQIRKLRAPIDNMIRLIKISNPDTTIRNENGETVGDLLSKATTEHERAWPMLIEILLESREQSMVALRRAKIIS